MFMTLKPASMADLMSIITHQNALSKKLAGCTNTCQVGATAGLSTNPHALGDMNKANQIGYFYQHCSGSGSKPGFCSRGPPS